MKHNCRLRGRDVTTLLLVLWASIFAFIGYQTFVKGGPLLPMVLYGDPQAISMRFGIPYVLAWFGFWSQGHMVGLIELGTAVVLLAAAAGFVFSRRPDFESDRLHILFAPMPIVFVAASLVAVHDLGEGVGTLLYWPVALAVAAILSLLVAPVLLSRWGLPAERRILLREAPIAMSNWHVARR